LRFDLGGIALISCGLFWIPPPNLFNYLIAFANHVKQVFDTLPSDAVNTNVHFTFVEAARVEVPKTKVEWDAQRAKFLAALESTKNYQPFFPGPTLNFSPKQHQGSVATFLAKVEGGRWKVVAENLGY